MMAVGRPIHVPHIQPGQEGFKEAVDAAHEQLVKALVELYDKYKVRAGEALGLVWEASGLRVRRAWGLWLHRWMQGAACAACLRHRGQGGSKQVRFGCCMDAVLGQFHAGSAAVSDVLAYASCAGVA